VATSSTSKRVERDRFDRLQPFPFSGIETLAFCRFPPTWPTGFGQQNDQKPRIPPPVVCPDVEPFESVAIVVERPQNRPLRTRAGGVGAV
jgi:hypothetical protein